MPDERWLADCGVHYLLLGVEIVLVHRGRRIVLRFDRVGTVATGAVDHGHRTTADGEAVLDHDGVVGRKGLRRRRIAEATRAELPPHIPTLDDLYATCGTGYDLSLDVKDPAAFARVLAVAAAAGDGAVGRLWLCHHDWQVVAGWRARSADVRLVDSTRIDRIKEGPERRAATLAGAGIDAVNLHNVDWTGGLVTLFHRFDVLAFGWDAQQPRVLAALVDMGIDGLYSDHVDRMVDAVGAAYPEAQ